MADSDNHSVIYRTEEEDYFLFSEKSGRLYGFDGFGGSVYRALKDGEYTVGELLDLVGENVEARRIVKTIDEILRGEEAPNTSEPDRTLLDCPQHPPSYKSKNPFHYRLGFCHFVIDTTDQWIIERILPELEYLRIDPPGSVEALRVEFSEGSTDTWAIRFNGMTVYRDLSDAELFPRLLDHIRIFCYRTIDYLISLHSAVLALGERVLILPAASGSGKSTLAAYLMHRGFDFFTDEVALIDREERVHPLPFPLMIKEGSWRPLEERDVLVEGRGTFHRRFDGQRLALMPPRRMATAPQSVRGGILVIPRYEKEGPGRLERLSTLETLAQITESGYEVRDSFDAETILRWVALVDDLEKYRLDYGDLDEAHHAIEELMRR